MAKGEWAFVVSSRLTRRAELLAGFTGAFIDREAETRGLDFIDKE
jgi:hypothetical protein